MKKKYMLMGLLFLFFFEFSLYQESMVVRRQMDDTQKTYEALAVDRQEQSLDVAITPEIEEIEVKPEKVQAEFIIQSNPFINFYKSNSDFSGWLGIKNTNIDYPVVRGNDNTTYLNLNFFKERDILGSIFMDYRNVGMGIDTHTIIYGHYTKYGQMFGDLEKYLEKDFLDANPDIIFTDPFTERRYRIFSIHVSPAEGTFLKMNFNGDEYQNFLTMLQSESIFPLNVPVTKDDHILSLVTCNYAIKDGRLFIHAVEIKN